MITYMYMAPLKHCMPLSAFGEIFPLGCLKGCLIKIILTDASFGRNYRGCVDAVFLEGIHDKGKRKGYCRKLCVKA